MVRLNTLSAALLFASLSFASAQAEPQQNGPSGGSPEATQPKGSPSGAGANSTHNQGKTAAQTDQAGTDEGKPDQMHKAPQGAQAAQDHPKKANKSAENDNSQGGQANAGKNGEQSGAQGGEGKADKEKNTNADENGKNANANDTEKKTGKNAEANEGMAGKNAENNKENGMKGGASQSTAEGKGNFEGKEGKSAKLDNEQVSKVKTYFSEHKASAPRVEKERVSVSIGVALPIGVALYDLPPNVIEIRGSCPIKYFAWGDDLVLVDACSREVVDIIPGVV